MYDSNNFGLSDDYEYHEICIDSMDSNQAYNPTYTNLNWPRITLGKELENVAAIKVLQVIVPKTYYVIDSTNNSFDVFYNVSSVWNDLGVATLTPGTYTESELNTEFKSKVDTIVTAMPTQNPALVITHTPAKMRWTSITFSPSSSTGSSARARLTRSSDSNISSTA